MRNSSSATTTHSMPLRTKVFATLLDRFGRASIVDMDRAGIRRSRASVTPAVPPVTWITGSVFGDLTGERHLHP